MIENRTYNSNYIEETYGCKSLTKGEQKDVDIINRAVKRLEAKDIMFFCYDDTVLLCRADENTPEFCLYESGSCEGMPIRETIVAELDVVCQAGGF